MAKSPYTDTLTLAEVAKLGWEQTRILQRKQHAPAQLTTFIDLLADRAVVLHGAGNTAAITKAIFTDEPTQEAAEAAISALTV
jgi:hypothetical protein